MQLIAHRFVDPTGGGDDAVLLLPATFDAPGVLRVYDKSGEPYEMQGTESFEIGPGSEISEVMA